MKKAEKNEQTGRKNVLQDEKIREADKYYGLQQEGFNLWAAAKCSHDALSCCGRRHAVRPWLLLYSCQSNCCCEIERPFVFPI